MKKIAISLFTLFSMVAVVAGGTWAAFSDTAKIEGNTVGTATIELNVAEEGIDGVALKKPINVNNLIPGEESGRFRAVLTNDSTREVNIKMYAERTSDSGSCQGVHLRANQGIEGVSTSEFYNGPVNALWGENNAEPVRNNVPVEGNIAIHQWASIDENANPDTTCTWDEIFVAVPSGDDTPTNGEDKGSN